MISCREDNTSKNYAWNDLFIHATPYSMLSSFTHDPFLVGLQIPCSAVLRLPWTKLEVPVFSPTCLLRAQQFYVMPVLSSFTNTVIMAAQCLRTPCSAAFVCPFENRYTSVFFRGRALCLRFMLIGNAVLWHYTDVGSVFYDLCTQPYCGRLSAGHLLIDCEDRSSPHRNDDLRLSVLHFLYRHTEGDRFVANELTSAVVRLMYVERLNDLFSSRLLSTKYERLFIDVDQPLRAPFRVSEVFRFHSACVGCHEIMDRLCFRLCGSCQYLTSWHSTAVSCICVIFVHPAKVSALVGFFLVAAGALDFTHRSSRAYSCLGSSKPTCTNAVVRAC